VATLDGDEIVYIARSTVSRVMSDDLHIGSRLPAYCTSIGRVLLAYMPAEQLEQYLARVVLTPHTARTVSSVEKLAPGAAQREASTATPLVDQEFEVGLRSIAVPVYSPTGRRGGHHQPERKRAAHPRCTRCRRVFCRICAMQPRSWAHSCADSIGAVAFFAFSRSRCDRENASLPISTRFGTAEARALPISSSIRLRSGQALKTCPSDQSAMAEVLLQLAYIRRSSLLLGRGKGSVHIHWGDRDRAIHLCAAGGQRCVNGERNGLALELRHRSASPGPSPLSFGQRARRSAFARAGAAPGQLMFRLGEHAGHRHRHPHHIAIDLPCSCGKGVCHRAGSRSDCSGLRRFSPGCRCHCTGLRRFGTGLRRLSPGPPLRFRLPGQPAPRLPRPGPPPRQSVLLPASACADAVSCSSSLIAENNPPTAIGSTSKSPSILVLSSLSVPLTISVRGLPPIAVWK